MPAETQHCTVTNGCHIVYILYQKSPDHQQFDMALWQASAKCCVQRCKAIPGLEVAAEPEGSMKLG